MIGAAILGILAGFLARLFVPGRQDIGFLMTVVLGLAGAAVGYVIFTLLLGIGDTDVFDLGSLPGAVIGSVILLLVYIKVIAPEEHAPAPATAGDREDRQRERDRQREQRGGGHEGAGDHEGGGGHGGGEGRGRRNR